MGQERAVQDSCGQTDLEGHPEKCASYVKSNYKQSNALKQGGGVSGKKQYGHQICVYKDRMERDKKEQRSEFKNLLKMENVFSEL